MQNFGESYEYKKATIEDIDELVRTRIIVLRAANKLSDGEDMSEVEKRSREYYKRALQTGEHISDRWIKMEPCDSIPKFWYNRC